MTLPITEACDKQVAEGKRKPDNELLETTKTSGIRTACHNIEHRLFSNLHLPEVRTSQHITFPPEVWFIKC